MCERIVFAEFDWKYHIFWSRTTEELNRKVSLFNYWTDLVLGSVQTYFLETSLYVCLKGATAGVWEGRFCWTWLEISRLFKYKNGGVVPKDFIVSMLKRFFLRLRRNLFLRSRCIHISERSHCRFVRGSTLLNLTGNITFFLNIKS